MRLRMRMRASFPKEEQPARGNAQSNNAVVDVEKNQSNHAVAEST